mmetsp:Transcript_7004/g.13779  ORF Transcript_7004/g.13779 Transcript_7004/m.13779 type:complete len:130 (-) Transcript_7004:235-624(-)
MLNVIVLTRAAGSQPEPPDQSHMLNTSAAHQVGSCLQEEQATVRTSTTGTELHLSWMSCRSSRPACSHLEQRQMRSIRCSSHTGTSRSLGQPAFPPYKKSTHRRNGRRFHPPLNRGHFHQRSLPFQPCS